MKSKKVLASSVSSLLQKKSPGTRNQPYRTLESETGNGAVLCCLHLKEF